MPDLEHYRGREQGYIKHALIERYLEPFTIKIGSKWDEIVYIDAFAGPWGAQAEDLSDTSFGIALDRLESGRTVLQGTLQRSPRVRAFLIEKDPEAFQKLQAFVLARRSNELEIECFQGEFEEVATKIDALTRSKRSFLFSLIDPKGWTGLSMAIVAPLIRRRSSEVLVNVMTSFVRRFAEVDQCRESYQDYFGRPGVREIIQETSREERQDIVVREYCRSLRELCGYQHVSSCVVLEPDKKGVKYFMVFATNDPMGIKVFKEAEAHAASLQDELKYAKEFGDQVPLFSSEAMVPVSTALRDKYRTLAFKRVEDMFQSMPEARYSEVFCKAMAMPLVTEKELVDFLIEHPRFNFRLDGVRRQKPSIKRDDWVVRAS